MNQLLSAMLFLPGLVIGLTFHEFAHAWVASLLGDKYSRRQGRVSLNPFRHLSLLGTAAIFIVHFGWGKPVMVNLYNFKHPRRDFLLCSLAGPAANLIIVGLCGLAMLLTRHTYSLGPAGVAFLELAHTFLFLVAVINTLLATLNLLPVPPLDGSKIWPCIFPALKPSFGPKMTWAFVILLVIAVRTDSLSPVLNATIGGVGRILPVSDKARHDDKLSQGQHALKLKRYARGEKLLTEAIDINPHSAEAFLDRTSARMNLGRLDEALDDVSLAIELQPTVADLYETRAVLLDYLERTEDAELDRQIAKSLRRLAGTATVPASQPATTTREAENSDVDF